MPTIGIGELEIVCHLFSFAKATNNLKIYRFESTSFENFKPKGGAANSGYVLSFWTAHKQNFEFTLLH